MLKSFFTKFSAVWIIGCLAGCALFKPGPEPSVTATQAKCTPSPTQTSQIDFPEVQGTMQTEGELWALLFFKEAHAQEDLKIVWRITGSGKQFSVQATNEDGTTVSPSWGPADHGASNWDRPGYEWGTGFNFPKPGCWTLKAARGATLGEIRLLVLAP